MTKIPTYAPKTYRPWSVFRITDGIENPYALMSFYSESEARAFAARATQTEKAWWGRKKPTKIVTYTVRKNGF